MDKRRTVIVTLLVVIFTALVCAFTFLVCAFAPPARQASADEIITYSNGDDFSVKWTEAATGSATLKMEADAKVTGNLSVAEGQTITLDLNGHKLDFMGTVANSKVSPITVNKNATLTISDSNSNAEHKYSVNADTGLYAFNADGSETLKGGIITGGCTDKANSDEGGGGCVYVVSQGNFIMNGGTLAGNYSAYNGGAVYIRTNGTFTMNGGMIAGNAAVNNGGGVYMGSNTIFTVSGSPVILYNNKLNKSGKISSTDNLNLRNNSIIIGDKLTATEPSIGITPYNITSITFQNFETKNPDNKISDFFKIDNGGYFDDNGNIVSHVVVSLTITTAPTKTSYDAFDELNKEGMVVTPKCSCGESHGTLDNNDVKIVYASGNCLHAGDTGVTVQYQDAKEPLNGLNVNKRKVSVTWEYTESAVSEENAWVWKQIDNNSHFVYDGQRKGLRVRARFNGAANDNGGAEHSYRGTDNALLVNGSVDALMANAGTYTLSVEDDNYVSDNTQSFEIKPLVIDLSDDETYRWTLSGNGVQSDLRDGYVDADNNYFAEAGAGREHVIRSIVRYRSNASGLEILLNNGEISDLLAASGKRTTITYTGNSVGGTGRYTAVATLKLADISNYKYTGAIAVAGERGMTIALSENDTKAVITKTWYVVEIDNGLAFSDGSEYTIADWNFGDDNQVALPRLEHGDDNFDPDNVSQTDDAISFKLYKNVNEQIGETFYRHNFYDYINKTMPVGAYTLHVSVKAVTDSEGTVHQAFTRPLNFTVRAGALSVTDNLNGKEFKYTYNGDVQLYGKELAPTATTLYANSADRQGIWKSADYNGLYGEAHITYVLLRWTPADSVAYEYVTETQLNNIRTPRQTPRDADTYTVYYKLSAPNYADYGDTTTFFKVVIVKAGVAKPADKTETLGDSGYTYSVAADALYEVVGSATFTQAGDHEITLRLKDANNYEWTADGAAQEGETVKIKLRLNAASVPETPETPDLPTPEVPDGGDGNQDETPEKTSLLWLILVIIASVVVACEVGYLIYRGVRRNRTEETEDK